MQVLAGDLGGQQPENLNAVFVDVNSNNQSRAVEK